MSETEIHSASRRVASGPSTPSRLIAAFFLLSGAWTLVSYLLVQAGLIELRPPQAQHMSSITAFEQGIILLTATAEVVAACCLWRQRGDFAMIGFSLALFLSLLLAVQRTIDSGLFAALGGAGIFATLFGWGLLGAVCVYTWRLQKPMNSNRQ
jgi:hypothetical protein